MSGGERAPTGTGELLHARSDDQDRLTEAAARIIALQKGHGGEIPGIIAVPVLLELVRRVRCTGINGRALLNMAHGVDGLIGWVAVEPDGTGCTICICDWHDAQETSGGEDAEQVRLELLQFLAQAVIWLDRQQRIIAVDARTSELAGFAATARAARGRNWAELFDVGGPGGLEHEGPSSPDGLSVSIAGSTESWQLHAVSAGTATRLLLLRAQEAEPQPSRSESDLLPDTMLGGELAPALRDPVARILSHGALIRDRMAGPLPDAYRGYASDLVRAGRHLAEVGESLPEVEALEAGTLRPARDAIDLRELAEHARQMLYLRAEKRGVRIVVEGHPAQACADKRKVLQIVLNLVTNAIDYGRSHADVTIRCRSGADRAEVTVADRGEGLTTAEQARIFEKFERLGRSGEGGSGLGLYIARRLARAMQGDLVVQSTPGEGSAFTLLLPLLARH